GMSEEFAELSCHGTESTGDGSLGEGFRCQTELPGKRCLPTTAKGRGKRAGLGVFWICQDGGSTEAFPKLPLFRRTKDGHFQTGRGNRAHRWNRKARLVPALGRRHQHSTSITRHGRTL